MIQKKIILYGICLVICLILSLQGASAINHQSMFTADRLSIGQSSYQNEVWVDDDYYDGGDNDGHTWGYDAFNDIQKGIDNVTDCGVVHVKEGSYTPLAIDHRNNLCIESISEDMPLVEGRIDAWDPTLPTPGYVYSVVFLNNSQNIQLSGLDIQGRNLIDRSYAVYLNGSSAVIQSCQLSPNERGNMNNLALRAQLCSELDLVDSTVLNYGRIGVYCRTGTTASIQNNTIIGQIYDDGDGDYVSYGIEIESLGEASHVTIQSNTIYNHNHLGTATWSSAGIIIDTWRYYELTEENCTATIKYNDIHDNMIGLQIVPNTEIVLERNKIHKNTDYGAVCDPYFDGESLVYENLIATINWWGDTSGPYHETENPTGQGDTITDYVVYEPWVTTLEPTIELTQPLNKYIYFNLNDIIEFKFPFIATVIIGKITIKAEAPECLYGIDTVEFYVDDDLKYTATQPPYEWVWNEDTTFFMYTLKTIIYDTQGNSADDDVHVWKLL